MTVFLDLVFLTFEDGLSSLKIITRAIPGVGLAFVVISSEDRLFTQLRKAW